MPLALHKLLPCFFLPIGVSCILIAVSLYRRSRLYAAIALAILFLSSLPATARMAIRLNEDRYPAIAISGVPACDAIVVLGGIVSPSQRRPGTLEWGESVDRFEGGLALFQSGKAPKLVFTGNATDATPAQSEGDLLKAVAIRRGVDGAEGLHRLALHVDGARPSARFRPNALGQHLSQDPSCNGPTDGEAALSGHILQIAMIVSS